MPENTTGKYKELWERYLPSIIKTIRETENLRHYTVLNPYEFMLAGNLKNYSFTINYVDGVACSKIKGSSVARVLVSVLDDSEEFRRAVSGKTLNIRLDKNFCLWISRPEKTTDLTFDFTV